MNFMTRVTKERNFVSTGSIFLYKIKYPVGWAVGTGLNTVGAEGLKKMSGKLQVSAERFPKGNWRGNWMGTKAEMNMVARRTIPNPPSFRP
jgi:hypothetical protein